MLARIDLEHKWLGVLKHGGNGMYTMSTLFYTSNFSSSVEKLLRFDF